MAMMITRFHKLIQSKVVWYIILGVIVIAFVGFFTPTMRSGGGTASNKQFVGELFGEKVSGPQYRRAWQDTYIWYTLSAGRQIPMNEQMSQRLEQEAWVRLAALKKAEEEKMLVTDAEVVEQIRQMPVFLSESGTFDSARYKAILSQLGLSPSQADELFRDQIALYKLMYRPMQAALIPPSELEEAYHMYTDRVVLDYAVLKREDVAKDVTVTREEAEAFYNENPKQFEMPPKVRVSYVEFPVEDFVDDVDEVSEDEALQVYNRNLEAYRIEPAEDVETTGDVATVEYKDFEEVKPEIVEQLRTASARRMAAQRASDLVAEIAPRAEDESPDFTGAAKDAGLEIRSLAAFGANETLPGIDPTAPFRQAAFGLQDNNFSSFSDPVVGQDSVYVLTLEQRYAAFVPPFDAVEADAMEAARNRAVTEKLAEEALEVVSAAEAAIEEGKTFAEGVALFDLDVQTTEEFDATEQLDNPYADVLIPASLNVEEGEVCQPAPVEDGVLIAHVAERTSTDMAIGLPALREDLIAGLSRAREQRLVASWQNALLEEADLKVFDRSTAE